MMDMAAAGLCAHPLLPQTWKEAGCDQEVQFAGSYPAAAENKREIYLLALILCQLQPAPSTGQVAECS